MNPNKKNAENADFFLCEICDFHCFKKSNWTTHLSTRKHKILTNPNEKEAEKNFQCDCGKKYKHNSSLCAHKKKCNYTDTINEILIKDGKPVVTHELILNVLQQNQELQQMMMEQINLDKLIWVTLGLKFLVIPHLEVIQVTIQLMVRLYIQDLDLSLF